MANSAATSSIDYTSRDFDGLRQSLLDYAAQSFPDWAPASEGDFGVLLLELMAYVGDVNSYYVDRALREAYLETATQRESVIQIAKLLGYRPINGNPASGTVTLQSSVGGATVFVPAGSRLATDFVPEIDGQIMFETEQDVYVPANGGTLTVAVVEGETKRDDVSRAPLTLGSSTGLPDQTFRLLNPRVYDGTVQAYVDTDEWTWVDDLLDSGPDDTHFSVYTDASGFTWIQFGDGLNGAIPPVGLDVRAVYRVGIGAQGNIPAGRVTSIYESDLTGLTIQRDASDNTKTTSSEMVGGSDPETTEEIRTNAPRVFRTQQRAVTLDDYENFALSVSGVSRAKAVAARTNSVTVYITGPNGIAPSAYLVGIVQRELTKRSLVGVTVSVGIPVFVPINVTLAVETWPTWSPTVVQEGVLAALRNRLSVAQNELGATFDVSDLYGVVMSVAGVRYVDLSLMVRSDADQSGTARIQLQPWEFPTLGNLNISTSGGI